MISDPNNDTGQGDSFNNGILDDVKSMKKTSSYSRAQIPTPLNHKNLLKANSELRLFRGENQKLRSLDQSQMEDLHTKSTNNSVFEKGKLGIPQNRIRNGRFFKETTPLRDSKGGTPTKQKPIRDSSVRKDLNATSITEANGEEEAVARKVKTDQKQSQVSVAVANNNRLRVKEGLSEQPSLQIKEEKSNADSQLRTTAYNNGRKFSSPFLETTNKLTPEKSSYSRSNIAKRNLTPSQGQKEKLAPSDPEKTTKVSRFQ